MRLEFHQLERRLEHLHVRRPERQRRLLASLASSGQQTPIIVVAAEQADRYLVIDGYQRIAALQQLGRDTVEAVLWSLIRPADAPPLTTVRSLAYFLPVIEEVLETQVGEEYFQYARQKLQRLRSS